MFQRAVSRQLWADVRDELVSFEQIKHPGWWISAGWHSDLGSVVAIEDECADVMLFSQSPLEARQENYPPANDNAWISEGRIEVR